MFSTASGNSVSVGDIDTGNNPVIVTLAATNGTITLGSTAGLTFGAGDGIDDPTMTFVGTIDEINSALDGLDLHAGRELPRKRGPDNHD